MEKHMYIYHISTGMGGSSHNYIINNYHKQHTIKCKILRVKSGFLTLNVAVNSYFFSVCALFPYAFVYYTDSLSLNITQN